MKNNVNLAYYRKEDWDRLMQIITDRESMHDTWEEWHETYQKTKAELTIMGMNVKVVVIDIDQLKAFCKKRKIKNDGKARSTYVSRF